MKIQAFALIQKLNKEQNQSLNLSFILRDISERVDEALRMFYKLDLRSLRF